jgi:SAM-dependent methyltransferase
VIERVPGRVLDIGAGAGRFALALQSRAIDVTALDVSPGAIEVCRERGVASTYLGTVEALAGERPNERFDTFLLMGNNLGLLQSAEHAPAVLAALASLSSRGARLVAEGNDARQTENALHLRYHDSNRARGRIAGQIRIRVRHADLTTGWFDYLMPSVAEVEDLIRDSGWRIEDCRAQDRTYVLVLQRA